MQEALAPPKMKQAAHQQGITGDRGITGIIGDRPRFSENNRGQTTFF
jgi:hypothetical protein